MTLIKDYMSVCSMTPPKELWLNCFVPLFTENHLEQLEVHVEGSTHASCTALII